MGNAADHEQQRMQRLNQVCDYVSRIMLAVQVGQQFVRRHHPTLQ
jgi:hypothetical protein